MNLKYFLNRYKLFAEENGEGQTSASSAPAADDAPESDDSSVDWAALNDGISPGADDAEPDDPSEGHQAAESPPAKRVPQQPEAIAEGEPAPEPALEVTPPEEEATPELTPPKELTPEEQAAESARIQQEYDRWEAAELTRLEDVYAIPEEDVTKLMTEPELVYPKLAAKLHVEVVKNALMCVQRMIPQMVPQVVQHQDLERKATVAFYGKNPDLKKYHSQVLQAGDIFRKLNPKATPEEAAEKVGNMVRTAMGLPPLAAGQPPAARTSGKPYQPARSGGSGVKPEPRKQTGDVDWASLAADDDD